jgi:hypothetical protein
VITATLLASTAFSTGTSWSAAPPRLILQDSSGIAPDRLHNTLLVGGSGSVRSGLLVVSDSGTAIASLLQDSTISGVSVATSGHEAWASSASDNALYGVNLDDLSATPRTVALPTGSGPTSVASVTDQYVAYVGDDLVGVVDTTSGHVTTTPTDAFAVRAIPYTTRFVVTTVNQAMVYDVAGGTLRQVAAHPLAGCPQVSAEAVSPDGQSLAVVCSQVTDGVIAASLLEYRLSDFSLATSYVIPNQPGSADNPNSVAYSLDGNYVAVGELTLYGNDVFLFHRTGSHVSGVYATDLGGGAGTSPDGLAFTGDGSRLQALEEITGGAHSPDGLALVSLPAASPAIPVPAAVLTLQSAPRAYVGDSVAVSGQLTFGNSPLPGAGQRVTITRSLAGHTDTVAVTTDAAGRFTFVNTPTTEGVATYTAVRDADSLHTSTSATATTLVTKRSTVLTLTADDRNGTPAAFRYTVHLGPTWSNRAVSLSVNGAPVAHGTVDASGNLVALFPDQCADQPPGCAQLAEATFAGDARDAPAVADLDLTSYLY